MLLMLLSCGLRREALRFRRGMEIAEEQAAASAADVKDLRGKLEVAEAQVAAVDSICTEEVRTCLQKKERPAPPAAACNSS